MIEGQRLPLFLDVHRIHNKMKKKKSVLSFMALATMLFAMGCGPSALEQEEARVATLKLEAATRAVDSTQLEADKTAHELDSLLQELSFN
jgi:hypothetical protein